MLSLLAVLKLIFLFACLTVCAAAGAESIYSLQGFTTSIKPQSRNIVTAAQKQ